MDSKFLFLNWFYKNNNFYKEIKEYIEKGTLSDNLVELFEAHKYEIESLITELKQKNIGITHYFQENYPQQLKGIDYPPYVLTYKGDLQLLKNQNNLLSIIGSRKPDPEAEYWLRSNIGKLKKTYTVISGGAIGCDQLAHKFSLENNLNTVVVSPVGILNIYPLCLNKILQCFDKKRILLVSQFHPKQQIAKRLFYPRNYSLAALGAKLVVVQAQVKSGSLVTAKYAMDFGKEILVTPSSPWDMRYSGNIKLLEEGASYITDFEYLNI